MATAASSYKRHRYPVDIISHCVWLYHRFSLSLRDVEEMMLARGVVVSHETIRLSGLPQMVGTRFSDFGH